MVNDAQPRGRPSSDPYWQDLYPIVWASVVRDLDRSDSTEIIEQLERDHPAAVKHYGVYLHVKVRNAITKAQRHLLARTMESDQRYAEALASGRFSTGRKGDSERQVYAAMLAIAQQA